MKSLFGEIPQIEMRILFVRIIQIELRQCHTYQQPMRSFINMRHLGYIMPIAPPRPCKKCRRLTRNASGYCDAHERSIKRPKDNRKIDPFYGSVMWQKRRHAYKTRHPLCELCRAKGKTAVTFCIDHIHEIKDGGPQMQDSNFMSLCRSCHEWKTKQMSRRRELGRYEVMAFVDELKARVRR